MRRIHNADLVEARGRSDDVPGALQQEQGHDVDVVDDKHEPAIQAGHVFEHLSRVYGFAFLLVLCCILFATGLCFPEYTVFPGDGSDATPLAAASNETRATAPKVKRSAWTLFTGLLFPSVVALRVMFATSCGDPHPLPGRARFAWKYAPQYVFFVHFWMLKALYSTYNIIFASTYINLPPRAPRWISTP